MLKKFFPDSFKWRQLKQLQKVIMTDITLKKMEYHRPAPLINEPNHNTGLMNDMRPGSYDIFYKGFAQDWTKFLADGIPEGCDLDPEFLTEAGHLSNSQQTA